MHPHIKESRDGHAAKIARLSGAHGTVALPSGNKPAPLEVASGPQKAVGMKAEGIKPKVNLGKFARGGRAKHKGTHVNVIVGGAPAAAPAMPPPGAMMPPPRPPMAPPMPPPGPGGPPPGMPGPGGPPPGLAGLMPPRKSGGRTFKKGGRVAKFDAGAGSGVGREEKSAAAARKSMKGKVV